MKFDVNTRARLMRRAEKFMRLRQEFVASDDCLPSMIMAAIQSGATTSGEIIRTIPSTSATATNTSHTNSTS